MRCAWIARACSGSGSCSESFVGTTIFVSGRSPWPCWSSRCPGAAQVRRSRFATSACSWLTVLCAHESGLFGRQRPYVRTSSRKHERLRRAAPSYDLSVQSVSLVVLAVHTYTERCRERPVSIYRSRDRWSGADFADFSGTPQIFPEDNRHCFEDYRPYVKYL